MINRRRLYGLAVVLIGALWIRALSAQDKSKPSAVTPKEAERLAYEVFKAWGSTKLPKFGLEITPKPIYSGFLTVEATWENPKPGSGVVGHVIVDERTGDVWDPFTCKLFSYPGLKRLQREIRNHLGLTNAEYQKLKRRPPC